MKQKIAILLGTLFASSILFFACQKDVKQSSLLSSNSSNGTVHPVIAPYSSITFNPDPGQVGQNFTASVSLDPVPDCGKAQLEQAQDNITGAPAPKEAVAAGTASWVTVAEWNAGDAMPLSYSYTPQTTGLVGYRAHYEPGGGQCGYTGRPAVSVNATIADGCLEGLFPQLAGAIPLTTDAKGTVWQFTVIYHLNTCTNGYTGKLQGGLIAGATLVSATPGYSVSAKAKSTVLSWSNVSDGDYEIVYKVKLAPGNDTPITGEWSFKYAGGLYGYTDRVNFSF